MSTPKPDNIWRLQAQFDIKGLVMALKDPSPATRKRAAAALRTINATQALPVLKYVVRVETDAEARASMLAAIDALDNPLIMDEAEGEHVVSEVEKLTEDLNSDDSKKAIQAAQAMSVLNDKTAVVPLILRFNNMQTPIQVRLAIAEALLKMESAPVEVALLANLRHADWEIRRNGAAILGQLKAEWAVEPLGKALGDPHPTVRKTSLAALKFIGTPDARKVVARFATALQRPAATSAKPNNQTAPANPSATSEAPKVLNDPTLPFAARSRLLDKAVPEVLQETTLPKDIKVMRVSEQKKKQGDVAQNELTTSILDNSAVDDYEKRRDANSHPSD